MAEKLIVKIGLHQMEKRMTRAQALRYGLRHMPKDLKRAGFDCIVARSDPELHGGDWFRINYGYQTEVPLRALGR